MSENLLPFETAKSEQEEKKVISGLKKIEIYVRPEQVNDIILAMEKLELEATVNNSQGFGKSKQRLSSGKSGGLSRLMPSERKTIVTIADSVVIEDLVREIKRINEKVEKKIGVMSIQPVDALMHL